MSTLYASFIDASAAEKATGALLDQGAKPADISIVANENFESAGVKKAEASENAGKTGISTTTADDATHGAVKGAELGLGVGILAILTSIMVPGFGLILGGGALAMALAGGAGTVVAGGAAGALVGYLKDQGVPEEVATRYSTDFMAGGAILSVSVPTGKLSAMEVEATLAKYGATNVASYYSNRAVVEDPALRAPQVPLVVNNTDQDPLVTTESIAQANPPHMTRVIDAQTGESRVIASNVDTVVVDPISGMPSAPTEQVVVVEEEEVLPVKREDVNLY